MSFHDGSSDFRVNIHSIPQQLCRLPLKETSWETQPRYPHTHSASNSRQEPFLRSTQVELNVYQWDERYIYLLIFHKNEPK